MISERILLTQGDLPFATGSLRYLDNDETSFDLEPRILVRVVVDPAFEPLLAVVDTAAQWCVFKLPPGINLERNFERLESQVILSTRLGRFHGDLYRGHVTIPADVGESITLEATVFLSPDWPGSNFVGYPGLLQRIRFAVDPAENLFYFGPL